MNSVWLVVTWVACLKAEGDGGGRFIEDLDLLGRFTSGSTGLFFTSIFARPRCVESCAFFFFPASWVSHCSALGQHVDPERTLEAPDLYDIAELRDVLPPTEDPHIDLVPPPALISHLTCRSASSSSLFT